jgi:hypothetical protein
MRRHEKSLLLVFTVMAKTTHHQKPLSFRWRLVATSRVQLNRSLFQVTVKSFLYSTIFACLKVMMRFGTKSA